MQHSPLEQVFGLFSASVPALKHLVFFHASILLHDADIASCVHGPPCVNLESCKFTFSVHSFVANFLTDTCLISRRSQLLYSSESVPIPPFDYMTSFHVFTLVFSS